MMKAVAFAMMMAAAAGTAPAALAAPPPSRTVAVTVYGSDPCPKAKDGEVIVCGRRPDSERYRIPKELRKREARPLESSWASRVAGLDEAARASRPNSCSVVGTFGQSGCWQQMLRQWAAERQQIRTDAASHP